MTRIIALAGSLRKQSYNKKLLHFLGKIISSFCDYEIISMKNIPLYNADEEEANGIPDAVTLIKEAIASADALLVATPEYNNSIPGVLKNAFDWLTRPPEDIPKVFYDKYIGLIGTTPGGFGTVNSQTAWLPIIRYLRLKPFYQRSLYLSRAHELFNDSDDIIDEATAANVSEYAKSFVQYVNSSS